MTSVTLGVRGWSVAGLVPARVTLILDNSCVSMHIVVTFVRIRTCNEKSTPFERKNFTLGSRLNDSRGRKSIFQLAGELVLRVQLRDRVREEQMTSSDEMETALSARLEALHTLGQAGSDGIADATSVGHLTALVSDALERAGRETYGLCGACEQRISPKRLAALPWARYCISCQEMQEGFAAEVRWNSAA